MVWRIEDRQGNESAKIKYDIVPYTRGRGLDLGCGMYKTYPHFIGLDNRKQWGHDLPPADEYALRMNVDIDCDCSNLDLFTSNSMDFVFSSHLLEHMSDPKKVLTNWWRLIKPGGYLVLYLPHAEFYPKVGEPGANPDHKHDFLPDDILKIMKNVASGWDMAVNEDRNEGNEYSFLQVYEKNVTDSKYTISCSRKKYPESKTCCVQRYGGFGDQIQASSILPGLKDEGYHITFMTTPRGYEILKHDPHIDDWIIQDDNQVPMEELHDYWEVWSKKFDRWICLTESAEANLLIMQYRVPYAWPSAARGLMCNVNYLEMVHAIAEVPMPPRPAFYSSEKEAKRAIKAKERIGKCILWVIDGSSVHKHMPWQDNIIANIMVETDYSIVLVGNELSSMLESGWVNEPRVIKTSGKWSIRETLAFVPHADIVVGPETGVMNVAGMLDVPKVLFLSHSSKENLSKHWKNTISLKAKSGCVECHKLIYGWKGCVRDSVEVPYNGKTLIVEGAQCQVRIDPVDIWDAIKESINVSKSDR